MHGNFNCRAHCSDTHPYLVTAVPVRYLIVRLLRFLKYCSRIAIGEIVKPSKRQRCYLQIPAKTKESVRF